MIKTCRFTFLPTRPLCPTGATWQVETGLSHDASVNVHDHFAHIQRTLALTEITMKNDAVGACTLTSSCTRLLTVTTLWAR